jgi:hypothetical protein
MNRATPQMRAFARRLIAREIGGNISSETNLPAAFPVSDKLCSQLTTLIGSSGFRALFSRALALASAELPWLRAVRVKVDGALEGFEKIQPQPTPGEFLEGREVLLAQLLGLLVTFIGPALTSRVVTEIWPKILISDLDLGNGDKNEKTK